MNKPMPTFTSRLAFILVAAGSAVGLGNIWAFPYVAGKNGGGGFVLVYIIALALIAAPALMAELTLGRLGRGSPPTTLKRLQKAVGSKVSWSFFGWMGLIANILVLSFYGVISGQAMAYVWFAIEGQFSGLSASQVYGMDGSFKASFYGPLYWTLSFITITCVIVAFDIRVGLERAGKFLMPMLFVLLLVLVGYAGIYGDMAAAVDFLFGFSDAHIDLKVIMEAVGQAFFTLSVGVGGLMMYAAYMGEDVNIARAALWIVLLDLSIALLAGLAIFPLVYSEGVDPAAGPGLVFVTLPILFAKLPGGMFMAVLFFLLLTFAALTSSISMITSGVARFEEAGVNRVLSAIIVGVITMVLSMLTILSFGPMADLYPFADIFPSLDGMTFFDLIREGINNIILPVGGLAFVLMVGWGLKSDMINTALKGSSPAFISGLMIIWRYVVPVAIIALISTAWFGH